MLCEAAHAGNEEMVRILLKQNADVGWKVKQSCYLLESILCVAYWFKVNIIVT